MIIFSYAKEEFFLLDQSQVKRLRGDITVFRLIEAYSDQMTGWKGVSVLFASPGVDGLNDFMKLDSYRFSLEL
jgi:hypothetical protein